MDNREAPSHLSAGAVDLEQVSHGSRAEAEGSAGSALPARSAAITPENFESDVVVRSTQVPVIVMLGSGRSEHSEAMRQIFERLVGEGESTTWLFRHADVDTTPEVAQAFGVRAVPTVIALAQGRPLANFEGAQPEEQISQWIAAVQQAVGDKLAGLPQGEEAAEDAGDPRMDAAAALLDRGDWDGALAAYDEILRAEPGHSEARSARANVLLLRRLEAEPEDPYRSSDEKILAGDPAGAFSELIERIAAREEDADAAKTRLLELFTLFDAGDPAVLAARTQLASALY